MTQYFCYICQSQCNIINRPDGEVQCTRCQDTFVEEMPEIPANVATGSRGVNPPPFVAEENPFGMFPGSPFAPLFNHNLRQPRPQQPPPASPAFQNHPQNPMMADPMANIMHQILAGIIGQAASGHPGEGAQLTIRFMAPAGEGGDADGGFRIHGNMGDYAWGAEGLDNILTALLNQFTDGHQARTLSQEEISRLPMTNVSQAHVDNGMQCTTCMETFGLDEPVAELNCKHIFHRDCIVPWLSRNNTCPICRTEIDPTKWISDSSKDTSSSTIADYDELD